MPVDSSCIRVALDSVAIGAPRRAGGLVQFPLLSAVAGPPAWLTTQDAFEQFVLEAREVQEGPTVSELRLVNHFDLPVLVIEGELLLGAKSNRAANTTTLMPPRSSLQLAVSCVEAGRWRARSRAFFTNGVRVLTCGGSPLGPGRQSRTPQAQDATGFGEPTSSTRHIRQLPAIDSRSWKQKRGISAPAASHACSSV